MRSVHFVGKDVISQGSGDGEVVPSKQLSESLACSAAEHGQSVAAFGGDSHASGWRHDTDDNLAMFDAIGDVRQRGEVGLLLLGRCVYAACWLVICRLGVTCHGSNSSMRLMG
jgi:hypothetical protein